MQVEQFLERSADRLPNKVAIICGESRHTYGQVEQACNQVANALLAWGVQRGDRVAILLENSLELAESVLAVLKAGAVFVVINPTTKADKLAYILNNCRVTALIVAASKLSHFKPLWEQTPHLKTVVAVGSEDSDADVSTFKAVHSWQEALTFSATRPPCKCIDVDLAALIYTSGSTGRPKGVMLTHLNIVSAATSITTYLENTEDDIILNVLPMSFDYGLYQLLMAFKIGGTIVIERSFNYPYRNVEKMIAEKVTGLPLVPTMSSLLLQIDLKNLKFDHLRYITNTAAALPVQHIIKLREMFPAVKIFSMYGLTECKRVSYLPPDQIDIRPTSVGRGMPNEEVYVVDENGERVAPGVIGQLVVRGSNVMKGYWELPEETNERLKPGAIPGEMLLYTGDLFKTDDEGYLYFVGRRDDIIKTRGEKVSPREVEDVLYALEGVQDAAVIGVPDAVLGSAIKALVTLKEGSILTEQDVLRHCKKSLEDFMVPKQVEIVAEMPKTSTGKISKRLLSVGAGADA